MSTSTSPLSLEYLSETLTLEQWKQRCGPNFLSSGVPASKPSLSIEVDLSRWPPAPCEAPIIHRHHGQGRVRLEYDHDNLYVGGRRVTHYRSMKQVGTLSIQGLLLYQELVHLPLLNACILDGAVGRPDLIPNTWKRDDDGNVIFTFFWDTIFADKDEALWVQALYFGRGSIWQKHAFRLTQSWLPHYRAAVTDEIRLPSSSGSCLSPRPCA